jgi:murein tripeptide amidase MpaA
MSDMISVSSDFDGGAIEVESAASAQDIRLRIRRDTGLEFLQWFYCRVDGLAGKTANIALTNAGQTTYPTGWEGYDVAVSEDNLHWFRVPSKFQDGVLSFSYAPAGNALFMAYFEPYSWARHEAMRARWADTPGVTVETIGQSVQGRAMHMVRVGEPAIGKKRIWVIARQHPGETMAEWFVEGLIERLLDGADPVSRSLRNRCVFYLVPNMNPDGSALGNLRVNAAGANLNREWSTPSAARSPEVLCVRERLHATGVDQFFDIHGDEGIPYVFISGCEMLPGISEAQKAKQAKFLADFKRASPDFQTVHGYAASRYSQDALKLASKYVGHTFGCLSATLEMPFKDNRNLPDARHGWSGARSKALGAAMLLPILWNLDES